MRIIAAILLLVSFGCSAVVSGGARYLAPKEEAKALILNSDGSVTIEDLDSKVGLFTGEWEQKGSNLIIRFLGDEFVYEIQEGSLQLQSIPNTSPAVDGMRSFERSGLSTRYTLVGY